MANAVDLVTLARAYQNLPSLGGTGQDAALGVLITSASRAIARYCRRDFISQSYDELYNGSGDRRLNLRQYPVQSVQAVRYRPVVVLRITNTQGSVNQQARVAVTSVGLTLTRVASGVKTTDTSVTFAGNVTLSAVATAVNALGNGWSATVEGGYTLWPSADLWVSNASTTDPDTNALAGQGALNAVQGVYAELRMHTFELSGYQVDARRGWLLRAIPYTDPELLHPEDLIWPVGIDNFRIQYTAGYATIPEDVQEACAELVASWYKMFDRSQMVIHLASGSGLASDMDKTGKIYPWPKNVKALLAPYRRFRVYDNQG